MTSAAITETRSIPHRRWGIALLLGFGVLVNYFDRVNLSVSQEALHNAFGISTVTFGYLLSAYSWTYAVFQLPSGLILDRFGVKVVGRIGTLLWSVATFAAAISTGLTGFLAARLLLGVGEAPTFPANAKAIGYWFPAQERSLATAIFDAAAKFASAIGVPALGVLLLRFGWRWSFAATGFLSLFYFVLFYMFYRSPSEDKSLSAVERDFIRQGGAQARGPSPGRKGRAARIPVAPEKGVGPCAGLLFIQLHLLSFVDVAAFLLVVDPSHRFNAFSAVHQHSLALGDLTDILMGGWLVDKLVQRGRDASLVRQAILIGGTAFGLGVVALHMPTTRPPLWFGSAWQLVDCLQPPRWPGPYPR